MPQRVGGFTGCYPVRFDGAPDGPLAGLGKWRGVPNFEHATLCRAFGLDPVRFYFDLPSTVRGTGSLSSGYGNNRSKLVNGFVMMAGCSEPVAKLTIIREGDSISDIDPLSRRDFEDLSRR